MIVPRLPALLLFFCLACVATNAAASMPARPVLRVMFIGNSLLYVQNLPGLLHTIAAAQPGGPLIETTTFVAPGGTLDERWQDGAAAKALRTGHWDVLVLQERGGVAACMVSSERREDRECRDSERAHRKFAALARERGARILLMGTWTHHAASQAGIDNGTRALARITHAKVIEFGETLHTRQARQPGRPTFADGLHLTLEGALLVALRFYRRLGDRVPTATDLDLDFTPLAADARIDPMIPLEAQLPRPGNRPTVRITAEVITPLLPIAVR